MVKVKYTQCLAVMAWALWASSALAAPSDKPPAQEENKSPAELSMGVASQQLQQVVQALALQEVQIAQLRARIAHKDELAAISDQLKEDWQKFGQQQKIVLELNGQIAQSTPPKAPGIAPALGKSNPIAPRAK